MKINTVCVKYFFSTLIVTALMLTGCTGGGSSGKSSQNVDTTNPSVSSTSPSNGATNISINSSIQVTFSKEINASTINSSSFILFDGTSNVNGSVSYSNKTATFIPDNDLDYNTTYTVTVKNSIKDLAANSMAADYSFSFTSGSAPDTTPPTVISTNPANSASNIAVNSSINITFSEEISSSTINTSSFIINNGSIDINGTISYSNKTATFIPDNDLDYNTTYTVTVKNSIKDLAANSMAADYSFSFTSGSAPDTTPPTVISTDPANSASNIAVNSSINITFSEDLDPSSVTTASFVVNDGTTNINGTVSYINKTATFTPLQKLHYLKTYTVTAKDTIKDIAGNPIASSYSFTFTTSREKYIFVKKFGSNGSADGQFSSPWGVDVDASGNIFVSDSGNHRIQKFDSNTVFLTKFGSNGSGDGQFTSPAGIKINSSGDMFIADRTNQRVQKFNSSGSFLLKWAISANCTGISLDTDYVYVSDYGPSRRIQSFDYNGTPVATINNTGDIPYSIAKSGSYIYVVLSTANTVKKYDTSGTLVASWGGAGSGDGQFNSPYGIAADSSGNIYVADTSNNRIQKFDGDGNYITQWGSSGSGDGQFNAPYGITSDSSGKIYVVDRSNSRIQIFSIE